MIKRHIKYIAVLSAAVLMQGCLKDGAPGAVRPAGDETEVAIAFELLADEDVAFTRSMDPVERESYIETLDILVFDVTDGQANSVFLYAVHGYDINNDDQVVKNFKASLKTAYNGREIRLFVIVNARTAWNNVKGNVISGMTTDGEIFEMLIFAEGMDGWRIADPQSLPMSGISGEATMSDDIKGSDFGTVELWRSVAGIDVELAYGCNFALEDVILCNIPNAGYISSRNVHNILTEPSTFLNDYEFSLPGYSTTGMRHMMYVPFKAAEPYAGERAFYVLVGGRYAAGSQRFDDAEKTWYRIECPDPVSSEYSISLENNFKYCIIINSVDGSGYTNKELAAANDATMWLNAAIISWETGDYMYDNISGPYRFDISCKQFDFDHMPRTVGSGDNEISLYTDFKLGWKVVDITYENGSAGWLHVDVGWGEPFVNNKLSIITDKNTLYVSRTGYIHFSAGRWQYTVRVSQKKSPLPPPSR